MLSKKYIIILLTFILFSNCTPKFIKNSGSNIKNNDIQTDLSDYTWSIKDYEIECKEINNPENTINFNNNNNTVSQKSIFMENSNSKNNINNNLNKKHIKDNIIPSSKQTISKANNNKFKNNILYMIKKGDTLLKISKLFNVLQDEILRTNKIKDGNKLYAGKIIIIPAYKKQNKIFSKNDLKNTNKKSNDQSVSNNSNLQKPVFCWPIKDVYSTKRDGLEGVRPIGLIITGKPSCAVIASADGIVTKVGYMRGFGNYIILKHINKYLSIYSNLKEISVNEGDVIKKGNNIGRIDGSKLHFQIGHYGKPENPLVYLPKEG